MAARRVSSQETGHHAEHHGHTSKYGASRLLPYAPPWIMWLFTLAVAALGHALWGRNPLFPMAAMMATQGGMWVAWRMSKPLHEVLRILSMMSVFVFGLYVIVVSIVGMTAVMWSLWGGIGFTICSYWTIRRLLLAENSKGIQAGTVMAERLLNVLNGAKLGNPQQIEGEAGPIKIPLTAKRGEQSISELKDLPEAIESLAGLRPGAVRMVPSREDRAQAEIRINPVDGLQDIIPWRGPSNFGASIHEPIPVGPYASQGLCEIYLTGDAEVGRNAAQWLVMGMTGAAKSYTMRMIIADALTRKDVTVWAHDHVKGLQTLKPLLEAGGIDWVTMTVADGKAMLGTVRDVVKARARWMGAKGYEQWTPDCGLNLLVVWIEEASDLAQLKILLQLAREARSVGVILFVSMQRASHTSIDTDTRAQLSGNICFGVESETDTRFGLPQHVIEAGAEPELWRTDKPGYCYISAPGIPDDMQAEALRAFMATPDMIVDAVKRGNVVRRPLSEEDDQVTIAAAGNVYAKRKPSEAFLPGHPLFNEAIGMVPVTKAKDGDENMTDSDYTNDFGNDAEDDDEMDNNEDDVSTDEAERALKTEVHLPPVPDSDVVTPLVNEKLTAEQCRERVQQYLRAINAAGVSNVTAPDILRMTPPIPRRREWIRMEMIRLAGDTDEVPDPQGFRLEHDDDMEAGEYRIVPPVMVGV